MEKDMQPTVFRVLLSTQMTAAKCAIRIRNLLTQIVLYSIRAFPSFSLLFRLGYGSDHLDARLGFSSLYQHTRCQPARLLQTHGSFPSPRNTNIRKMVQLWPYLLCHDLRPEHVEEPNFLQARILWTIRR